MIHTAHVDALTLGNLDPNVNEQFVDACESIAQLFHDESAKFATGSRKAEINVKVTFDHNLEHRSTTMTVELSSKLPKYRRTANTLKLPRGGTRFLIEIEDANQVDLFHQPDTTDKEN